MSSTILLAALLGNTYATWWFVFVRSFLRGIPNFCVQLVINIEGICVHTTASCYCSQGLEIKQSQFSIQVFKSQTSMLCTDGVSKYETNSGEHLNLLHSVLCVSLTYIFYRIFCYIQLYFYVCKIGKILGGRNSYFNKLKCKQS